MKKIKKITKFNEKSLKLMNELNKNKTLRFFEEIKYNLFQFDLDNEKSLKSLKKIV